MMRLKIISMLTSLCWKIEDALNEANYNLHDRQRERKGTQEVKRRKKQAQKIQKAKELLESEGYVFERGWEHIKYKGKLYYTKMVEEFEHFDRDTIIITAVCESKMSRG